MRSLRRISISAVMLLAAVLLAQQPIPPFEGDGNEQHDGQPKFCVNHDHSGYIHNCSCKGMANKDCENEMPGQEKGGGESANCKVYCRKSACRCIDPCTS